MARPKIYDAEKIADELLVYIEESEDPMIVEFCYINKYTRDTLYRLASENDRLSDIIKECHAKQEIRTIRNIENGILNPTFGIFKLKQKQYGWSDKQEVEMSGGLNLTIEDQLAKLIEGDED